MISIDTNILFHRFNAHSPRQAPAHTWLTSAAGEEDVPISELILAESYGRLRDPATLKQPLSADEAVEIIQTYRTPPRWRLIGLPMDCRPLHDALWEISSRPRLRPPETPRRAVRPQHDRPGCYRFCDGQRNGL